MQQFSVGTFTSDSGCLLACDPMYIISSRGRAEIRDCRTGTWEAYVLRSDRKMYGGFRVWYLLAVHSDSPLDRETLLRTIGKGDLPEGFSPVSREVWVDLAECGIFDSGAARECGPDTSEETGFELHMDEEFCSLCAQVIKSGGDIPAGVLPNGTVADSGLGDGSYWCCARRDGDGLADAVFLRF